MTENFRKRLENQGVNFTRETAKAQLERAGMTLGSTWNRYRAEAPSNDQKPTPQQAATAGDCGD